MGSALGRSVERISKIVYDQSIAEQPISPTFIDWHPHRHPSGPGWLGICSPCEGQLVVFVGVLYLIMAAIAFVFPASAVLAFVFVTAFWAIFTGGLMLRAAFRLAVPYGRWWLALGGIVSIVFGVLLAIAPVVGAVVLTWWLGAYAIVFGVVILVLAFRLRRQRTSTPAMAAGAGS